MLRIGCPCGSTELTIADEPLAHLFCHCGDCRRMHGGAYSPESVYPARAVAVTRGEPGRWTLERNPRSWCRGCGVRLFIDVPARGLRGVNGALLPEGGFRPTFHMHCRHAVLPVVDALPHYSGVAPMFGGPPDTVDW